MIRGAEMISHEGYVKCLLRPNYLQFDVLFERSRNFFKPIL